MRIPLHARGVAAGMVVACALSAPDAAPAQEPAGLLRLAAAQVDEQALRRLDLLVENLADGGELRLASSRRDAQLPGRTQQYFQQYHDGVPVHGAGVSRQRAGGATVSILGTLDTGIEISAAPRLQPAEALALLEQETGAGPATADLPELVIVRTLGGRHVLAYRAAMRDLRTYFIDARSGSIAHTESMVREQTVGAGAGVRGQRKKLSTSQAGGRYEAYDRLRPAEILTLDMRYDEERLDELVTGEAVWTAGDLASDADNEWSDPAVVDGHAYVGFAYDYFAGRHDWHGLDGSNTRIFTLVNPSTDFENAFYAFPPYGPEGSGVMAFGETADGTPLVSADVVAHEFTHGVTHHTVMERTEVGLLDSYWFIPGPASFTIERDLQGFSLGVGTHACGRTYTWRSPIRPDFDGRDFRWLCDEEYRFMLFANEGGALHETWSDVFATAVEFMVHEPPIGPLRADYELGEDTPPAIRSLARPRSQPLVEGFPSSYPDTQGGMVRFLVGEFLDQGRGFEGVRNFFAPYGSVDGENIIFLGTIFYDGVHWNSTVLSHAFYLAVEGGTNATTGLSVAGVGADRRHDVEQVYFRAMAKLMPARANVPIAAAALRQAAADLFGTGDAAFRAVHQALNAVGLAHGGG